MTPLGPHTRHVCERPELKLVYTVHTTQLWSRTLVQTPPLLSQETRSRSTCLAEPRVLRCRHPGTTSSDAELASGRRHGTVHSTH